MNDHFSEMINVLKEMRELLRVMAEPAIAERDKKSRDALRSCAASSIKRHAALLMDGSRTQGKIVEECGIHKARLSEFVKALRELNLLKGDPMLPQLVISIPPNFFDDTEES